MDAVIKVGGSLAETPKALRALCKNLSKLAKKYSFVVVPGGGRFADAVREYDAKFHLAPEVSHKLAILGMDQYGILLSQLVPNACTFDQLSETNSLQKKGKVLVFLPCKELSREKSLEASWDVTSDSIAAQVALRLGAGKLLLITDVDGIFSEDPKVNPAAELMAEVSVEVLLKMGNRTSVDSFLPRVLADNNLDCYVVNGIHPQRIEAIFSGQGGVYTQIISKIRL